MAQAGRQARSKKGRSSSSLMAAIPDFSNFVIHSDFRKTPYMPGILSTLGHSK
jgi:hypothetical protein